MAEQKLSIILTKGTLDAAYPPLILALTASALSIESAVFFAFYGLTVIHREKVKKLKLSPLANPAMPVVLPDEIKKKLPFLSALERLPGLPQLVGVLPGATDLITALFKKRLEEKNVPPVEKLLKDCLEAGVKLYPCQTSMELLGFKKEELIEGVEEPVGAGFFLSYAYEAEKPVVLFV
ncbi:MAG: peroxiredoxin family protein [Aquificae bacterium]|nr:peroxiredoxin family protein [Aquificota bacterium]